MFQDFSLATGMAVPGYIEMPFSGPEDRSPPGSKAPPGRRTFTVSKGRCHSDVLQGPSGGALPGPKGGTIFSRTLLKGSS